jgi:hypothetical protein
VKVGGAQVPCDVLDRPSADGQSVTRYFLSPQVPGWLVRVESGPPGKLQATSWVVEFSR